MATAGQAGPLVALGAVPVSSAAAGKAEI